MDDFGDFPDGEKGEEPRRTTAAQKPARRRSMPSVYWDEDGPGMAFSSGVNPTFIDLYKDLPPYLKTLPTDSADER